MVAMGNLSQIQKHKAQTGAPGPDRKSQDSSHSSFRKGHTGKQWRRNKKWKAEATGD